MKPLKLIRLTLHWLCVYSPNQKYSRWQKFASVVFTSLVLIGNTTGLVAGMVFCIRSFSTDIEKAMNTFSLIAGLTSMILTMAIAIVQRHKFTDTMEHLLNIYETSMPQKFDKI